MYSLGAGGVGTYDESEGQSQHLKSPNEFHLAQHCGLYERLGDIFLQNLRCNILHPNEMVMQLLINLLLANWDDLYFLKWSRYFSVLLAKTEWNANTKWTQAYLDALNHSWPGYWILFSGPSPIPPTIYYPQKWDHEASTQNPIQVLSMSPSWGFVPTFSGNFTHKSLHSAYFLPLLCSMAH